MNINYNLIPVDKNLTLDERVCTQCKTVLERLDDGNGDLSFLHEVSTKIVMVIMELWVQDLDESPTTIVSSDFELARWNAQNRKQDAATMMREVFSEASWIPFE